MALPNANTGTIGGFQPQGGGFSTPQAAGAAPMPVDQGDMAALMGLAQALGLVNPGKPVQGSPTVIQANMPKAPGQFAVPRLQAGGMSPLAASIFGG
jgi:hypothetical protein